MSDFFNKSLNDFFASKSRNYWDFSNRKKTQLEKLFKYPGKMVSDMIFEILDFFNKNLDIKNICDPFMGSGTILDLAVKLNINLIYGNDLNPYSYILNNNKFFYHDITDDLVEKDILLFKEKYENIKLQEFYFFNKIDKWYKKNVISELSKIRYILYSNEFCYKHLLEVALINISKDFSNDRKSTSKLHIKKDTDIDKIDSSLIFSKFLSYFLSITKAITDELNIYNRKGNINLLNENINKINNFIEKKSIDLIVTSPPYGDNKTTISYGQFSILPLLWLDKFNKTNYEYNFSKIDTDSLGGRLEDSKRKKEYLMKISPTFFKLTEKFVNNNSFNKVTNFIYDFLEALENINDILKDQGYIVFILGNRRVSNIEIPFDQITIELLNYFNDYLLVSNFKRNIPIKTIPRITSRVQNKPVESISKETILILQKIV
ncbi:hypothetical protein LT336_00340 [Spiroplasma sp. JKS002671]|uniref:hypothetical protein n=1 Tax=Spiroplasma attinicola TaxID=2904537 RepID=UPI002022B70D|nr:hypothetical protein [Spiroplasma sp. JKS002671]MCL8210596.1 hypothetical protein [Spiroplasma sp. JKS002671]